jgi:outer membrane protein assembly factor BamB
MAGPYELRARLGSGGMGRVYLGLSDAGRAVAVKVIHPMLAQDREFLARFRREVSAAQAVSGAFTAPVVAAGPDDDPPWLATVLVPGPSLAEAVADGGPLQAAPAWRLAAGLAEALAAVHAAGLVHRDLKPANVLLAADGPRVIDFGISRALAGTALTASGMTVGTPGFMSPEQAQGGPPEPASDVFSLGCVLAFPVTGVSPFGDGTAADVLYRVVHAPPDLDGVPGPLREVVTSCLAKTPADRPSLLRLAEAVKANTPPDAALSLASFWPDELTGLIRSYQARLSIRPSASTGPGTTRLDAVQAATHSVVAGPGGPPASPARPRPGVPRRRVLAGLAGAAGVVAAGSGVAAWALSQGHAPAEQGQSSRPAARTSPAAGPPGTKLWSFATPGGQVYSVVVDPAAPSVIYLANTNNGAAPDAHNLYALHAATGTQIWEVANLGESYSLLTLAGGVLYFGTDFHKVYAVNASDGSMRWQYLTGERVFSPPAVTDGIVYVGSNDRNLYALSAATGHKLWGFRAGGAVESGPVVHALGVVGVVYFGSDDGAVYRIDAATGIQYWRYPTGGYVRESPAVGGGVVYAASDDQHVYALDASTGRFLWKFATSAHPVSPVLASGILYVGGADNILYALHAVTGQKIWTFPASGDQVSWRVAIADGIVYAGSLDGRVYALNAANGTKLWSYATGGPVNSALQVAGGTVYAGSDDGSLYALRA